MDYKTYTVGELIDALKQFAADLPVCVLAEYDGFCVSGGEVFAVRQDDFTRSDEHYNLSDVNGVIIRAAEELCFVG